MELGKIDYKFKGFNSVNNTIWQGIENEVQNCVNELTIYWLDELPENKMGFIINIVPDEIR